MKIKTSDLIGPALDWAVEALEISVMRKNGEHVKQWWVDEKHTNPSPYHTDWLRGGPIIEREKLDVAYLSRQGEWYCYHRNRSVDDMVINVGFGPTPLVAAMRCYVASKLGDEIEIPKELK